MKKMKNLGFGVLVVSLIICIFIFASFRQEPGIWAALIGVFGLLLTFSVTAKMTFKFHKSDKLAEAKLNTYIDLTEKYTDSLFFIILNREADRQAVEDDLIRKLQSFVISYNKACLLSNSSTKLQLDFYFKQIMDLHKIFLEIMKVLCLMQLILRKKQLNYLGY